MESIHQAAFNGDEAEVTRLVQEDGRRLNAQIQGVASSAIEGSTPLMVAASQGHDTIVARLIELGADVGQFDAKGWQAAHWACGNRRSSTLGLLLGAGAPFNARDNNGFTPLMDAACYAATECVKLLLARGGDVLELDAQTSHGSTALHLAASEDHDEIVQLLLLAGSDPTIRDQYGQTPLDEARENESNASIPLLRAALAEPQRPRSLLKARTLLDAAHAVRAARIDARDKEGLPLPGQREKAIAAAPVYLKQRVGQGRELPWVEVVQSEANEQLLACIKYALGLEGGGGVVLEGQEPAVGMLAEVFVELLEYTVPKWDPARKGLPLGDGYVQEEEDEEEEDSSEDGDSEDDDYSDDEDGDDGDGGY